VRVSGSSSDCQLRLKDCGPALRFMMIPDMDPRLTIAPDLRPQRAASYMASEGAVRLLTKALAPE
jgi:hypothetical protein